MAQASKAVRKYRRIKRENTLLYKMVKSLAAQRDMYMNTLKAMHEQAKEAVEAKTEKSKVTITKVEDDVDISVPEVQEVGGQLDPQVQG